MAKLLQFTQAYKDVDFIQPSSTPFHVSIICWVEVWDPDDFHARCLMIFL